ncbi:MAG TPA: tetratricopeptide repeat protein [Gemmatimonadaceae bacterium]
MPENCFRLNVLGSLSLQSEGASPPSGALQKRRLSLLAILAVARDRGLSRDRIQSYLWPESDSARARHALDQLVYAIRRVFDTDPFISEGRDLRLDPAVITTDVAEFESALAAGRLETAVDVYGGRLLYGVQVGESRDLESWIDAEAVRLEQVYQSTLDTLARDTAAKGDLARAAEWRRKLAASDPLSSRNALSLIETLAQSGDVAGAVQHARTYQDLVRRELEVEPDPQIEALVAAITKHSARQHVVRPLLPLAAPVANTPAEYPEKVRESNPSHLWMLGFSIPVLLIVALALAAASARPKRDDVRDTAKVAYLRGVNSWQDRSRSALDTAVVYFRKAAELDPAYAEAEAGLANAYVMIGYSGYRPGDAMFPKAKAAAQRAIILDSTLAAPYAALGMELTWERDFRSAARAFRKAIALDPNYATAHQWYGILLRIVGDIPGSVRETGAAARLDPLSLQIQNNYATFLRASGQKDAAMQHYLKMIAEEPDSSWTQRNPWLLTNMAVSYARARKFDEAMRFAERAVRILPGHPRAQSALADVYREMGKPDLARKAFEKSDPHNPHYAAYRAMNFVDEGQVDSAFVWFDRVTDWGIPVLISLRGLDNIKSDPRYNALLQRLGMNVRLD